MEDQELISLDLKNLRCPLPILKTKRRLSELASGTLLEVWATDPGAWSDFEQFCQHTGHVLLEREAFDDERFRFVIKRK